MDQQTLQIVAGIAGIALIAWHFRGTLKSWLPNFSGGPSTDSELRIEAVEQIESAMVICEKLGAVKARDCCRHAARSLWGEDEKPHS